MIRNLKIGIALAAALALSAVGASAAQAAESSLEVGAVPAFLTGTQGVVNKLTITGPAGEVLAVAKCEVATLAAETNAALVKEVTFTPGYAGCTKGGLAAAWVVNGCTYTFTNTPVALTWKMDIVCPAGQSMEIVQGACVTSIPPQGPLAAITFANVAGPPKHVTTTFNVVGINEIGGLGCPVALRGAHNADLTGTQTIKAFKEVAGVEGAQVNLEAK